MLLSDYNVIGQYGTTSTSLNTPHQTHTRLTHTHTLIYTSYMDNSIFIALVKMVCFKEKKRKEMPALLSVLISCRATHWNAFTEISVLYLYTHTLIIKASYGVGLL